jgi:competence protein ComFC
MGLMSYVLWILIMGFVKVALEDWLDFAFPRLCACCSDNLLRSEMEICWSCYANLPFSVHGYGMENPVAKSLWGRTPLVGGYFLLNYKAKSEASKMMKALKYDGGVMMAEKLGELMGEELLKDPNYRPFSHLVPVPMHPKKEMKRGYNPAYLIALGMSKSLQVPVNEKVLVKSKMTATQTKKNRLDRWYQTKHSFEFVGKEDHWEHVALVDDVVTTGATAERCLRSMYVNGVMSASLVSLAYTI